MAARPTHDRIAVKRAMAYREEWSADRRGVSRLDSWAAGCVGSQQKWEVMANVEFTGIHHVKLPVSVLARSREWYERVLGYTVDREFPDADGVVRGVGGRLPGAGVPVALRQDAQAAAGNAGFDPVSFAIADRLLRRPLDRPFRRARRSPLRDQARQPGLGGRRP